MIGPTKPIINKHTSTKNQPTQAHPQQSHDQQQSQIFNDLNIPFESFQILQGHNKPVTTISVDNRGNRMCTGSLDFKVKMWDFHGMNKNLSSFRTLQPIDSHPIKNLDYNKQGSFFLVAAGAKQVIIVDRDGAKCIETIKGYAYLKDLHKTKGHTAMTYDAKFHPNNYNQFATASFDGTIRLWDTQKTLEGVQQQMTWHALLRCNGAIGHMTRVCSCCYLSGGNTVFGGCFDGSLQGFDTRTHHRPIFLLRNAHKQNQEYTKILSHRNGNLLLSRSFDQSMKIFDLRRFKQPIFEQKQLNNYYPGSKMCFSPNHQYLLVGTTKSPQNLQDQTVIYFYDMHTFDIKIKASMPDSVNDIFWSQPINQIFVGLSNSNVQLYYDKRLSKKGVLMCLQKQSRIKRPQEQIKLKPVFLPNALLPQILTNNFKKEQQKLRKNLIKTRGPQLPMQGPGRGGKIGIASTITQYVIKSLNEAPRQREDAQEVLKQYDKVAQMTNKFNYAYKYTQPQKIFDLTASEGKQFQFLRNIGKICPHCGLKLCTCKNKYILDKE